MGREFRTGGLPGFVVDYESVSRAPGIQIDWNQVEDNYRTTNFTVTVSGTGVQAAKGATTLPVTALLGPIPQGALLDFGQVSVAVVVGAAGALANATSVPVGALSGPIPNGTVLNFGTNKFATLNADAAAGATSLTTLAIPTALVQNDAATYVDTKLVEVNAAAAKGATSLTVEALPSAIYGGNTAVYEGADTLFGYLGHKLILAGTIMARCSSGLYIPRAIAANGETAVGLLIDTTEQYARQESLSGVGLFTGGQFYKDLLPERAAGSFAAWLTEMVNTYAGFKFVAFADDRTTGALAIAGR